MHRTYTKRIFIVIISFLLISNLTHAQDWVQTRGPGGGSVVDFIEKNGSILAATYGGVFRSTDNGDTWNRSMTGVQDGVFLSTFTSAGNYIYAGSWSDGLYRSANNGLSWTHIDMQVNNLFISKIFASHDTLYVGCDGCGVYRSTDEAGSFQPINNGYPGSAFVYSFAQIGPYLFTGLRGNGGSVGVYRTPVNSINWVQVNNGLITFPSIIDMKTKGNSLFVTTESFLSSGIFRSDDYGDTWISKTPSLPGAENPTYLAVNGNDIYFGTEGDAPYKSSDEGLTWQRVNNGLKPLTVFSLLAGSSALFVGYERGIARTTDNGANWDKKTNGLTNTSITSLYADGNSTLYATGRTMNIGSNDGVFYTNDGGQNWNSLNEGLLPNPQVNTITKTGGNIIIGTDNFGLYIKTPADPAFRRATGLEDNPRVISLLNIGQYVFAGTGSSGQLYRSVDYGLTWVQSNNGFGAQSGEVDAIYQSGGTIYAGGYYGLYKSTDLGVNWTWAGNGIYPGFTVSGITSLGTDLFAVTRNNNGIYKSTNNGANWVSVNNGLPAIISFNAIIAAGGKLYAASDLGVYRSDDGGNSWVTMNSGLLYNVNSLSLALFNNKIYLGTDETAVWGHVGSPLPISFSNFSGKENDGTVDLYWQTAGADNGYFDIQRSEDGQTFVSAGTLNGSTGSATQTYRFTDDLPHSGINYYRIIMVNSSGQKEYSNIIAINIGHTGKMEMLISPNPASTQTTVSILASKKGHAVIKAYETSGRLVATLYEGEISSNFFKTLNLSRMVKGFYILKLTINGESLSRKLIIQ